MCEQILKNYFEDDGSQLFLIFIHYLRQVLVDGRNMWVGIILDTIIKVAGWRVFVVGQGTPQRDIFSVSGESRILVLKHIK